MCRLLVSEEECQFFIENGYLVVPGLLSDSEIEELRKDTVTLARGEYNCDGIDPVPDTLTDQQAIGRILCIHQPHYVSETIEKYVKHPKNMWYSEPNYCCSPTILGW